MFVSLSVAEDESDEQENNWFDWIKRAESMNLDMRCRVACYGTINHR